MKSPEERHEGNDRDAETKRKIIVGVLTRFSLGFIAMGALFFLSAGTIRYPNGWLFMLALPLFVIALVIPGLDYRFGWSRAPLWLSLAALAVMIGGSLLNVLVMNQNPWSDTRCTWPWSSCAFPRRSYWDPGIP